MTPNDYQRAAMRTTTDEDPARLALELAAEAGEVAGDVAKAMRRGTAPDHSALAAELGDVLWCVAVLAGALGYSLEHIMARNLTKLRLRHPGEGYTHHPAAADAAAVADRKTP
jgi:NTP pyrophosphatase (non-canonical NTP hydrolase)